MFTWIYAIDEGVYVVERGEAMNFCSRSGFSCALFLKRRYPNVRSNIRQALAKTVGMITAKFAEVVSEDGFAEGFEVETRLMLDTSKTVQVLDWRSYEYVLGKLVPYNQSSASRTSCPGWAAERRNHSHLLKVISLPERQ